jgi:aspartate racemase
MIRPPMRRIGVIGGMGPEATVLFMSRVLAATKAEDDADHVPMLIDNNPQVPSRIQALIEKTGADPAPVLERMAKRLQDMGAEALAMPCNTAHHYAPNIRAAVTIPLLDMVALSMAKVKALNLPNPVIGMLCSPAVRITGAFEAPARANGLQLHYLANDAPLLSLIRQIKKSGAGPEARASFQGLCAALQSEGANHLLVACSELSLLTDAIPANVSWTDTLDVLAEASVNFSLGLSVEQENAA